MPIKLNLREQTIWITLFGLWLAEECVIGVDEKEFLKEQEKARELSHAKSSGENSGESIVMDVYDIANIEAFVPAVQTL